MESWCMCLERKRNKSEDQDRSVLSCCLTALLWNLDAIWEACYDAGCFTSAASEIFWRCQRSRSENTDICHGPRPLSLMQSLWRLNWDRLDTWYGWTTNNWQRLHCSRSWQMVNECLGRSLLDWNFKWMAEKRLLLTALLWALLSSKESEFLKQVGQMIFIRNALSANTGDQTQLLQ